MKWMSSPLISVVNWGSALNFASHFFQSYSLPQYRARFCIVRSGTPSDESGTHSRSGHLVALTRRRRSVRSASEALKLNGRISVPASPFGCATSVRVCVMALTFPKTFNGPAATVAAVTPTKRRRSKSGGLDIWMASLMEGISGDRGGKLLDHGIGHDGRLDQEFRDQASQGSRPRWACVSLRA